VGGSAAYGNQRWVIPIVSHTQPHTMDDEVRVVPILLVGDEEVGKSTFLSYDFLSLLLPPEEFWLGSNRDLS